MDNSGSGVSLATDYEKIMERRESWRPEAVRPVTLPAFFAEIGLYPASEATESPVPFGDVRRVLCETFHDSLQMRQELAHWICGETGVWTTAQPILIVMPLDAGTDVVVFTLDFPNVKLCVERLAAEKAPSHFFVIGSAKPESPSMTVH